MAFAASSKAATLERRTKDRELTHWFPDLSKRITISKDAHVNHIVRHLDAKISAAVLSR